MKSIFSVLALLLVSCTAFAQQGRFVNAKSGLRLRETPEPQGKVVATIPHGTWVELVSKKGDLASKNYTIEGKKGKFVRVKLDEKQGFVFEGFLQTKYVQPEDVTLYALANSGLRLREKADPNSTVLATLPFGDSLRSDGIVENFWDVEAKSPKRIFTVEGNKGFWQKVVYKNKKGYVFSGFVSEYYKPMVFKTPFVFLEEGWNCGDIVRNQSEYNWFGWYVKGEKSEMKAVQQITFSLAPGSDDGNMLINRTDRTLKGDTSIYIVGVRKNFAQQLKAQKVKGKNLGFNYNYDNDKPQGVSPEKPNFTFAGYNFKLTFSRTLNGKPEDEWDIKRASLVLEATDGSQKQILRNYDNSKEMTNGNYPFGYSGIDIVWYGDLDGDGKLDFLLNFNNEIGYSTELYLSSAAEKGQVIKKVGETTTCGC